MARRSHIIGKQILDVEIDVGEDFFALQQEVSRVFHTRVSPALDALFSRYVGTDTVVRLDRLEVDLGRLDRARLEDDLAARLVAALEPMLAAQLGAVASDERASPTAHAARRPSGKGGVFEAHDQKAGEQRAARQDLVEEGGLERHSLEGHTIELWHYFLQKGYLPWWAPVLKPFEFETQVLEALETQPAFLAQTRTVVQQNPGALRRLVLQGSDVFLDRLVGAYAPSLSPRLLHVAQGFSRWLTGHPTQGITPRVFREVFWQEALQEVFADLPEDAAWAERAVVRRTLRRLSRRISVAYPAFLARIQAVFQEEESGVASAQARIIQQLAKALASPARPAEEAAARAVEQTDPARGSEKTLRPAQVEPSEAEALAEAEARDVVADDAVGAKPAEQERQPPVRQEASLPEGEEAAAPFVLGESDEAVEEEAMRAGGDAPTQTRREAPVARGEPEALEERSPREERLGAESVKEGTELYLDNAGLVLLHPYLPAHFEHLGLVEDKAFVDEDARQKAIYQLQYLATGNDGQAPEYSLMLNKLLCGHPLALPLARDVVLTEVEKAEAENLLKALIRNWPALKNTSPDGLREGFLQREGKLARKPLNWLLQVEQKTLDILLGRLPWGLSMIKLPWMPELLRVEWA